MKKKVAIILICIVFCFATTIANVVTFNMHHIRTCHEHNCVKCSIIMNLSNLLKGLLLFTMLFSSVKGIKSIASKIKLWNSDITSRTLINFKVQFNE